MVAAPYTPPQQVIQPLTTQNVPRYVPPRNYMWIIMVGITILLVGGMIIVSWGFIDDPDDWDNDREEYADTVRTINTVGNMIQYIGLVVMSTGMLFGAVKDESLHPNVRMGMFIALGLIVGFKIMSLYWWPNP